MLPYRKAAFSAATPFRIRSRRAAVDAIFRAMILS
jgi:hypothetical protein